LSSPLGTIVLMAEIYIDNSLKLAMCWLSSLKVFDLRALKLPGALYSATIKVRLFSSVLRRQAIWPGKTRSGT